MSKKFFTYALAALLSCGLLFSVQSTVKFSEIEKTPELKTLNKEHNLMRISKLGQGSKATLSLNLKASILNVFQNPDDNKEILLKLTDQEKSNEVYLLELNSKNKPQELAQKYSELNAVAIAEPNISLNLEATAHKYEESDELQEDTKDPEPKSNTKHVVVAVVDSGIDPEHPLFEGRLVDGYDFVERDQKPNDELGHGTHISGVIINNSRNATIMPIRFTEGREGKLSDLIASLMFAAEHKADVVNLSLSTPQYSAIMQETIQYLDSQDIIIVSAAGNYGTWLEFYPAAWPEAISVGALTKTGAKLPESNFGEWIDFSAPGKSVYSAYPDNTFHLLSGTSQSAAKVSAQIANIIYTEKSASLTQAEIINELVKKAMPTPDEYDMGYRLY